MPSDKKPHLIVRLFKRYELTILILLTTLLVTGELNIKITGTSIGIGLLLDVLRIYIRGAYFQRKI